jgi:GxxExxY protein
MNGFEVNYKGSVVGIGRVDLLVAEVLIVELKAVDRVVDVHRAQVLSYLRATRCMLGLILSLKCPILKNGIERIVLS